MTREPAWRRRRRPVWDREPRISDWHPPAPLFAAVNRVANAQQRAIDLITDRLDAIDQGKADRGREARARRLGR